VAVHDLEDEGGERAKDRMVDTERHTKIRIKSDEINGESDCEHSKYKCRLISNIASEAILHSRHRRRRKERRKSHQSNAIQQEENR
jgi:hypothetical protein